MVSSSSSGALAERDCSDGSTTVDLSTRVGGLRLANPVMPASGCFGPELASLVSVERLGAVVTKTTFAEARPGNRSHRLTEGSYGMLNSVGIPSQGTARFRRSGLPEYQSLGTPVVVSVGGLTAEEYWRAVEELAGTEHATLEVNVSCPNLERGGTTLDADAAAMSRVVSGVVARSAKPVIVKLSPKLTGIDGTAKVAEDAGASAVTICNSFPALAVDAHTRGARLGNGTGGLSGPTVKPLALRMVWQAAQAVTIPIVGCGGIRTAGDAIDFLIAGASAVQVGTANFGHPHAMPQLVADLSETLVELGTRELTDLVGTLTV